MEFMKHFFLFLFFLISISFAGGVYATTPKSSIEKVILPKNENVNLSRYLEQVLFEAGVPEKPRAYLVDLSRPNLSKVPEGEISEKKEQLMKSLHVLLIDLATKQPLLLSNGKKDFSAQMYKIPSADFLSIDHLNYLKSQQIFDGLTVKDVKVILDVVPIWPWTRGKNK